MNTALKIISIQHELVQSIGNSLDLTEMLKTFLRVCHARLALSSAHIFVCQSETIRLSTAEAEPVSHYMSLPRKRDGLLWENNGQLMELVSDFSASHANDKVYETPLGLFHCYKINDVGIFVIEYNQLLEQTIQQVIAPVLNKLAISCKAAINHQALILEIKDRKKIEKKIRYQASHDHLTGLLNRSAMERALDNALVCSANNACSGALLLLDLVEFKNINDVMGHHIGDEILRIIAQRLKEVVPSGYPVARFVGDEFMILMKELSVNTSSADKQINLMVSRISAALEIPIETSSGTFSISCSIGYERFVDDSKTAEDVVKHAGVAMYSASKAGTAKSVAYDPVMSRELDRRLNYVKEMKKALQNNEFKLYYQPQYDHKNNIIGAEALLRWQHPERGFESPAEYIPIAEESDLIIQIGDYVLEQACEDIKTIEQLVLPHRFKKISINVSAKQLAQNDFYYKVIDCIYHKDIKPSHLSIEITEGIMMGNVEHSINMLKQLRDYNVECAIDDFGTGYSSLVYLKRLPAQLLKIDRAFVTDIHKDADNYSIANMIIGLGRSLKMDIIAEGVETQEELDSLMELGCRQYQGFFFSRPLPFQQFVELLQS